MHRLPLEDRLHHKGRHKVFLVTDPLGFEFILEDADDLVALDEGELALVSLREQPR
jgi:hypothetical protein